MTWPITNKRIAHLIAFLLLNGFSTCYAAPYDSAQAFIEGKQLFQTNCSACHGVHKEIMGPLLASVTKKRSEDWLMHFIKNSQNVIASGDAYANFLYSRYHQQVMPSFHSLSDQEIKNILFYIKVESPNVEQTNGDAAAVLQNSNPTILEGKQLFQNQCAQCHAILHEDDYGPALGSVTKRRPKEWLHAFIKNSQTVINAGDPYAVHLYNAFSQRVMVPMEFLKDDEINSILNYIEFVSTSSQAKAGVNGRSFLINQVAIPPPSSPFDTEPQMHFFRIVFYIVGVLTIGLLIVVIRKLLRQLQD